MKDKIFIAWSDLEVAKKVGIMLDKNGYSYQIGGNAQNDTSNITVGATVLEQIKKCNQAIIIFSKKTVQDENNKQYEFVSGNLFFEFGYAIAKYGTYKLHCVKRKNDNITMPAALKTTYVTELDGDSDDVFVENIYKYFEGRQKMTVEKEKMELINNRHIIREFIDKHYSNEGSKCSDYELAQYILFDMQASHMFLDEKTVLDELTRFRGDYQNQFSDELRLSVDFSIGFLTLMTKLIKQNNEGEVYVD